MMCELTSYTFYMLVFMLDIDECTTLSPCNQFCTNTPGSYQCSCLGGYELFDGHTCRGQQRQIFIVACLDHTANSKAQTCTYICHADIDECGSSPCEHTCINTPGSFACICREGYELNSDGRTCSCMFNYNAIPISYLCMYS